MKGFLFYSRRKIKTDDFKYFFLRFVSAIWESNQLVVLGGEKPDGWWFQEQWRTRKDKTKRRGPTILMVVAWFDDDEDENGDDDDEDDDDPASRCTPWRRGSVRSNDENDVVLWIISRAKGHADFFFFLSFFFFFFWKGVEIGSQITRWEGGCRK